MAGDEILLDAEERMEKAIEILKKNLSGIRTGRANPVWLIPCVLKSTVLQRL